MDTLKKPLSGGVIKKLEKQFQKSAETKSLVPKLEGVVEKLKVKTETVVEKKIETEETVGLMKVIRDGYNYSDDTVPRGWGVKNLMFNGKVNQRYFINPFGSVFTSRVKALEEMMNYPEKYSIEDINIMQKRLKSSHVDKVIEAVNKMKQSEKISSSPKQQSITSPGSPTMSGWLKDDDGLLPAGWSYSCEVVNNKERRLGYKRIFRFKNEAGTVIKSSWKAVNFMKKQKKYSKLDIDKFIQFFRLQKKEQVEKDRNLSDPQLNVSKEFKKEVPEDSTGINDDELLVDLHKLKKMVEDTEKTMENSLDFLKDVTVKEEEDDETFNKCVL